MAKENNCKVLIIDDELETRQELYERLYKDAIEENWYNIVFAPTGESALDIIKKDKKQEIVLIVLDLRLDGAKIDGLQFANTLAESHIDKKIIVWTAYPQWENSFSPIAKAQIIKVVNRTDYPSSYLKDLCDAFILGQQIEPPGKQGIDQNSKMIGYSTLRKLVKSLPDEQRYNLIIEILRFFPPNFLKQIEREIPAKIQEVFEESLNRDTLKQWILEQQKLKNLPVDIPPAEELHNLCLEINERTKKRRSNSPEKTYLDYYLHWDYHGEHDKKYLRKTIVELLPPELQYPSKFLTNSDALKVKYKNYVNPESYPDNELD